MKYIIGFIIGLSLVAGVAKASGRVQWLASFWVQRGSNKVDINKYQDGEVTCYVAVSSIDGYANGVGTSISCLK